MTLPYRRLLLALDGTPWSEHLLDLVARWAAPGRCAITLVHIVEEGGPERVHGAPHLHDAQTAARYLEDCAERLRRIGHATACMLRRSYPEDVANALSLTADDQQCDVVLLATHGRVDPRRWLRGSVAQRVLARARCDVLQLTPRSRPPAPGPHHLLVPLDGDRSHETALQRALWLAGEDQGSVDLVHVLPGHQDTDGLGALRARFAPHADRFLRRRGERLRTAYLERCAREANTDSVRVRPVIEMGNPAGVLASLTHRLGIDLVVLASHGRHGLAAWGREHLPGRLIERLDVPLLMVAADPRKPLARP